jgi:hypothetical protein
LDCLGTILRDFTTQYGIKPPPKLQIRNPLFPSLA